MAVKNPSLFEPPARRTSLSGNLYCKNTVGGIIEQTTSLLNLNGIESPRIEAEILVAEVLKVSKVALYSRLNQPFSKATKSILEELLQRRLLHEPIAYITGIREFWSLDFLVNPSVLIPRPETEILVETGLELLADGSSVCTRIADVATGSGCVAIALAAEFPAAHILATDNSYAAVRVALANARKHSVTNQLNFICADLLTALSKGKCLFDLIVCNPPYIENEAVNKLAPDIKNWEPQSALKGGADGLDFYRILLRQAPKYLRPRGWLAIEIGGDQLTAIRRLEQISSDISFTACRQDYAKSDRVVVYQKTA